MQEFTDSTDLLGHIAGLTSLRDVDLLELSLLKSVYTIVNPIEVSLVTIDNQNSIHKKVDYASGRHGTVCKKVTAEEDFLGACEQLDNSTLEYCTVSAATDLLSVFMLSHNRLVSHYVTIRSVVGASKNQSQQILGMLQIYRNFKQLLQESKTDELTGLSNRKTFDSTLRKIHESIMPAYEECSDDKRLIDQVEHYWLAMIDIDKFKIINDTLGHLIGDEVLVRVSQSLQASIRSEDMLFRYGGDEFALIVRSPDMKTTQMVLERIRLSVEAIKIPSAGDLSISLGCVKSSVDVFHLTLIEHADKALYNSKNTGRNRTSFYEDIKIIEPINSAAQSSMVDLF
ncbi:MAG: GGDEF domain-containing protein [Pseudomonadales bacterium]|nr:GGDEF domain-containing protein [Pseudomonadales bacterium]